MKDSSRVQLASGYLRAEVGELAKQDDPWVQPWGCMNIQVSGPKTGFSTLALLTFGKVFVVGGGVL